MFTATLITVLLAADPKPAAAPPAPSPDAWLASADAAFKTAMLQVPCKGVLKEQKDICVGLVAHSTAKRPELAAGTIYLVGKAWTVEPAANGKVTINPVPEVQVLVLARDAQGGLKGTGSTLEPENKQDEEQLTNLKRALEDIGTGKQERMAVELSLQPTVMALGPAATQPVEASATGIRFKGTSTEIRKLGQAFTMAGTRGKAYVVAVFAPIGASK
jgi:hypothetical protein